MAKKRKPEGPKCENIRAWIAKQTTSPPEKLGRHLNELRRLLKSSARGSIEWYHDVGRCVAPFFPENTRHYGASVAELLADKLQPGRERKDKRLTNLLYEARDLANTYRYKREIRSLAKRKLANGKPLTVNHIKRLVSVDDDEQREALLSDCLEGSWSVRRLHREVQNRIGHKRSAGGRKARDRVKERDEDREPGPKPAVAVREVKHYAKRWMANHKIWFVGRKAALKRVPKNEYSEALKKDLKETTTELRKMQEALDGDLACLEELEEKMIAALGD